MNQPKQVNKLAYNVLSNAVLLLLLASILGSSCSETGKTQGPAAPAQKPALQPQSQTTATVQEEPKPPEYVYEVRGRRDPFAPLLGHKEKAGPKAMRPPLERYDIAEFKLSGIVWGGFGYNAMVEGPDGKGYFIRIGTVIGQNKGIVKKITKDKVVVEEQYKNFSGGTERRQIVLELRKSQEGLQ